MRQAMEMFNIICGVCYVIGLLVSIFTAGTVVKISKSFHCGNVTDQSNVTNKIKGSTISGPYNGGSSIHVNEKGNGGTFGAPAQQEAKRYEGNSG